MNFDITAKFTESPPLRLGLRAASLLALMLSPLVQAPACAEEPLLPLSVTTTTVPANGDLNPYGIAFVPQTAAHWQNSKLKPGDLLVANFNASSNLQGTGTTIIQYTPSEKVFPAPNAELFFKETSSQVPGLTLALGVLERGAIIVGSISPPAATPVGGPLLVINPAGALVQTITAGDTNKIHGPWGIAIADHFVSASIFISNVLNGTVTRLDVTISDSGVLTVHNTTTIASGYGFRTDPAAFVVGPAGLAYEKETDTLYVASEVDNAIYKVANAATRTASTGKGAVFASGGNLRSPLGLVLARNGHLIVTNADVVNADPAFPSEVLEFTHDGRFLRQYNVNEAQGAAFGIALTPLHGDGNRDNDDGRLAFAAVNDASNDVTIRVLSER